MHKLPRSLRKQTAVSYSIENKSHSSFCQISFVCRMTGFEFIDVKPFFEVENLATGSYHCMVVQFVLKRKLGSWIFQVQMWMLECNFSVPFCIVSKKSLGYLICRCSCRLLSWSRCLGRCSGQKWTQGLRYCFFPQRINCTVVWSKVWQAVPSVLVLRCLQLGLELALILTITSVNTGINKSIPNVSFIKPIDIWCFACLFFVCAALVMCIVTSYLKTKAEQKAKSLVIRKHAIGKIWRRKFKKTRSNKIPRAGNKTNNYRTGFQILTCFSRGFFPSLFLLFNLCFWLTYLSWASWSPWELSLWWDSPASLFGPILCEGFMLGPCNLQIWVPWLG